MSEPIVLESNQNHATITDSGICPTLPASMGMGGGYVPMIAISIDSYNQTASTEVAEPLRSAEGGDTKPKVLVIKDDDDISRQMESSISRRSDVDDSYIGRDRRG